MTGARLVAGLLLGCLLFTLAGCGNKGPLFLPEEEEEQQKSDAQTEAE